MIRLLGPVVRIGLVAGIAVGAFVGAAYVTHYWESWRAADRGPVIAIDTIDYNCGLPGCGWPWLEQAWGDVGCSAAEVGTGASCDEQYALPGWFDVVPFDGLPDLYLPVARREDGRYRSLEEVYALACAVHPQLDGATPLWPMDEADRDAYEVRGDGWYVGSGSGPDGGPAIYDLPPLTSDVQRALAGEPVVVHPGMEMVPSRGCEAARAPARPTAGARPTPTASPAAKPTPPVRRQRWRISVSGYELQELDPYWAVTHGRFFGGVSFDWDLQAEFMLRREKGAWVFESGAVTYASITPQPAYGPPGAWDLELPLRCPACDDLKAGRKVTGDVSGDLVRISWGSFVPHLTVTGRITLPCKPQPACSREGVRRYDSERFLWVLSGHWFKLADGAGESERWRSPQGLRVLHYTVTLLQLGD